MTIPVSVLLKKKEHYERDARHGPEDFHEQIFEIEKAGDWIVHRVPDDHVEVATKFERPKKIPVGNLWHHKSCGQCGHIPGYSTSIYWAMRKPDRSIWTVW